MSDTSGPDDRNRVARVFISSTFQDMQRERDILVRQTFPALRARLRTRGVAVIEMDLRWGITREQAENGEVLPICLREIDRCRPYFIGLIGGRYGWVPPPQAITDQLRKVFPSLEGATACSVTEMEIVHGVFAQPGAFERAVFFFRESGNDESEGEGAREKLEGLKQRIRACGVAVHPYSSAEEIGKAVEQALGAMLEKEFPDAAAPDLYGRIARQHAAYAEERRGLYIGGGAYLEALDRWIDEAGAPPILVHGEPGSGKSALIANWLAARCGSAPGDPVFEHYLGASPESADPEWLLRRLWVFLDIVTGEEIRPGAADPSLDDLARELPERLAAANAFAEKSGIRILIALDGLDKLSAGEELQWLPETLPGRIRLVCTAQDSKAMRAEASRGWRCLDMRPLTGDERNTFLVKTLQTWGRALSPERARRILTHPLAGAPLFLKTILDELRYSATEVRLDERLAFYLTAENLPALFARVLDRLEQDCGQDFAAQALTMIWASRAGIEEAEIMAATGASPLKWTVLRNGLNDTLRDHQGLLTFNHDFLREAVAERYVLDDASKRTAHAALAARFAAHAPDDRQAEELPYQFRMAEDWKGLEALLCDLDRFVLVLSMCGPGELLGYWNALAEHGRDSEALLTAALEARCGDAIPERDLELASFVGIFLSESGATGAESEMLAKRLVAASQRIRGAEHEETLRAQARLASLLRERGDFAGAQAMEEHLLDIRRRILGEQDAHTLTAMNNLALTLAARGDFKGAAALQERVLQARLQTPGPDAPVTLTSMVNLALTLKEQGDFARARELHMRAYNTMLRVRGREHPDTLRTAANMASTLMACGAFAEAEALEQSTADAMARVFGPEHPNTVIALNGLAQCLEERGDYEGAKRLHERCLDISIRRLGPDHPDTLTSMSNLASVLDDLGDFASALDLQKRVAEGNRRDLGPDHPDTLVSKNNLAMILQHSGDTKAAYAMLGEVAEARQRTLGEDHPSTLATLGNMAAIHFDIGDYDSAREFQEHVLAADARVLGPEHPDTVAMMNNLALTYSNLGRHADALTLAERALDIRARIFGPEHLETRAAMGNLAYILYESGQVEHAKALLERLLEILRRVAGPDDPETRAVLERAAELRAISDAPGNREEPPKV